MSKTYHNYRNSKGQFTDSPATRSQRAIEELYRAFDYFNSEFADNELPKVVITIQQAGRRKALGWFGEGFWTDNVCNTGVSEINLSAEWLGRTTEQVLETLLHEMAHLYNAVRGVRDCTSGQYHNKHFKTAAEKFGLDVHRHGNRGFAVTHLGDAAIKAIKQLDLSDDVFSSLRRKKAQKNQVKRYMSLIVDSDYEELITQGMNMTGLSQKQFVQHAISIAIQTPVTA